MKSRENENQFRNAKSELKQQQNALDAERVKKFGVLIDTKKYIAMVELGEVILGLLGEN